jgi:predicted SnoaL-like aldol condensation-catalyzing enzyme
LFNKRDYAAAERFWSPHYIQHSAHIEPGREGLFALVKAAPSDMRYENVLIVADGDYLMLHGRFSNVGQPADWIVADIVRIEDGLLAEHWDVIQDEATREDSKSGLPMFGDTFPPGSDSTISERRQRPRSNGRARPRRLRNTEIED